MARTEVREEILKVGSELIVRGGFGQTGIDAVLKKAKVPKGSFYYYFASKEEFGLAVIDRFGAEMLAHLRASLAEDGRSPLDRLKAFFQAGRARMGHAECKRGCLFGDLGQEMAHQNEAFRKRLEEVFEAWKAEVAACLAQAVELEELARSSDPTSLADFILSGWEGAILRAKVKRSVEPIDQFLKVLFSKVLVA